jgi:MFS family permease
MPLTSPASDRARWTALYVLCTGMLMIVLDATVVNVALPSIQDDLGFTASSLAWVVNAYLIAFGGLLLLAGRLGDLIGRRVMFLAGLFVFSVASLLCGAAQSQEMLVAARFLQGIGGAMTSAVILGMIVTMFPEPREQAKAIGRSPSSRRPAARSASWPAASSPRRSTGTGSSSSTCRSASRPRDGARLIAGRGPRPARRGRRPRRRAHHRLADARRLHDRRARGRAGLGRRPDAAARRDLARPARRVRRPRGDGRAPAHAAAHLPLAQRAGANVVQILAVAGMFGMFFLGALYLQRVLRYDALETGLAFLPVTVVMGTLSVRLHRPAGHALRRPAPRAVRPRALRGRAGAVHPRPRRRGVLGARLPRDAAPRHGRRPVLPRADDACDVGRHAERRGPGLGLINTTAQVGGALGLAVLATLAKSRSDDLIAAGEPTASALVSGYHLAFWIGAALVVAAIAVAATVLQPAPPQHHEAAMPAGEPAFEAA